jgi:hypothetical protein
MVKRKRFKILWLQNIEPLSRKHFKGKDSKYYGGETLTSFWFSWLGGGGSKYYGCDISKPSPLYILRVGIQSILVVRH